MFNRKKLLIAYFLIFLVGLFFRLYQLSSVPYGFHVDEVKAALNAFSILKTGHDDKGNYFPMYYDSFGDFRPTGIIYSIIPSIAVFGNTVFSARFPSALIGSLTFIPLVLIVLLLNKKNGRLISLFASILISLNPWHIVISRSTSEAVFALFFSLFGIYFYLRSIINNRKFDQFYSIIFFLLSYFYYHNIRFLAPVFCLYIFLYYLYQKKITFSFKNIIFPILIIFLSIIFLSSKESQGRASQVSLLSDFQVLYETQKRPIEEGQNNVLVARVFHNKISSYLRRFCEEYKSYFSTEFLVGTSAKPIRYTTPYIGLLTYFELILFFIGLFLVLKNKELLIFLGLLIIAPTVSAITTEDVPNLHRAFFMVPFFILVESYGFFLLFKFKKIFFIFYLLNFVYFSHMYFVHQKHDLASYYRNGGNVELIKEINLLKSKYSKIYITNSPDNLYPWYAYFNQLIPSKLAQQNVDNLIFTYEKCPSEKILKDILTTNSRDLIIDAEGCVVDPVLAKEKNIKFLKNINRPDGSPPYILLEKN
jgi:hypothetical protein